MVVSPIAGLIVDGWAELDRVLDGLSYEDATRQVDGGSSFAWTLGHMTNQLDTWVNVRLQYLPPHPVFTAPGWRMGGTGAADNWDEVRQAAIDVRTSARPYLEALTDTDLAVEMLYAGTLPGLVGKNVSVRYTLLRIAAHTFFHIGDIASVRSRRLGQSVGDYPGPLLACM
jgi:DinB superfamily